MGAKSDYAENKFIDWIRGQVMPTIASWYVGLAISTAGKHAVSTAFALNDTLFIQDDDSQWRLYKCTTAGTTTGTKPAYPGVNNEAITDGSAVMTEQHTGLEDASAIVEPTGGAYARVALDNSMTALAGTQGAGTTVASTGSSGTTSNNAALAFTDPTGDWGWCGLFVLFDALSGGNVWIVDGLTNPMNITTGMTNVQFAAAALTYTDDD